MPNYMDAFSFAADVAAGKRVSEPDDPEETKVFCSTILSASVSARAELEAKCRLYEAFFGDTTKNIEYILRPWNSYRAAMDKKRVERTSAGRAAAAVFGIEPDISKRFYDSMRFLRRAGRAKLRELEKRDDKKTVSRKDIEIWNIRGGAKYAEAREAFLAAVDEAESPETRVLWKLTLDYSRSVKEAIESVVACGSSADADKFLRYARVGGAWAYGPDFRPFHRHVIASGIFDLRILEACFSFPGVSLIDNKGEGPDRTYVRASSGRGGVDGTVLKFLVDRTIGSGYPVDAEALFEAAIDSDSAAKDFDIILETTGNAGDANLVLSLFVDLLLKKEKILPAEFLDKYAREFGKVSAAYAFKDPRRILRAYLYKTEAANDDVVEFFYVRQYGDDKEDPRDLLARYLFAVETPAARVLHAMIDGGEDAVGVLYSGGRDDALTTCLRESPSLEAVEVLAGEFPDDPEKAYLRTYLASYERKYDARVVEFLFRKYGCGSGEDDPARVMYESLRKASWVGSPGSKKKDEIDDETFLAVLEVLTREGYRPPEDIPRTCLTMSRIRWKIVEHFLRSGYSMKKALPSSDNVRYALFKSAPVPGDPLSYVFTKGESELSSVSSSNFVREELLLTILGESVSVREYFAFSANLLFKSYKREAAPVLFETLNRLIDSGLSDETFLRLSGFVFSLDSDCREAEKCVAKIAWITENVSGEVVL